ncbi:MAG: 3-phosphoshikimate 1-carboxyvinyltransferase [Gammaproteobacteria bacterium]
MRPSPAIGGRMGVPGDKSISHRALMLGAMARGSTRVHGFLEAADCLATRDALRALGVNIEGPADAAVSIEGVGLRGFRKPPGVLDLGNSGTAMRLLAGLLAGQDFDCTLAGDASLCRRPMERVAEPLRRMGADVRTSSGVAPLFIRGGRALSGVHYRMPVASAQVKSALLLAGLNARGETCIEEPAPTRDHTERMLRAFGCSVDCGPRGVCIDGSQALEACDIEVPGDFSSAAFFIVAACIGAGPSLEIENVGVNRTRTGLLEALSQMGADIALLRPRRAGNEPVADIRVKPARLRGISVPPALVPAMIDELPVLLIAAARADGQTLVSGARELRVKESDRIAAMAAGLRALGAAVTETPDGLRIEGGNLRGGSVDACGDHRVAMAFAVAGAVAEEPVEIRGVSCVATSYPGFVTAATEAGIDIRAMDA